VANHQGPYCPDQADKSNILINRDYTKRLSNKGFGVLVWERVA
jgi:hypothetical protein